MPSDSFKLPAFIGKLAVATLLSLVAWEVLLRLALVSPVVHRADPRLGWMPRGGSHALQSEEGWSRIGFNELGLHDKPIGPKKKGELRIVVLGDSFVEGRQVAQEDTFCARLGRMLDTQPTQGAHTSIRVINAGRTAATSAYFIGLAASYKKLLQPDIVVELVENRNWTDSLNRRLTSEWVVVPAGPSFRVLFRPKASMVSNSFRLLEKAHLTNTALFEKVSRRLIGSGLGDVAKHVANQQAGPPPGEERAMVWQLQKLKVLYPHFLIVQLPRASSQRFGLLPPLPLETQTEAHCRSLGIAFLSLRGAFQRDFEATNVPPFGFVNTLPWEGHTNRHGNSIIAQALFKYFSVPGRLSVWAPGR